MRALSRALLPLLALALSCGPAVAERPYRSNDLQLITAYTAKEACSCLFVMEQTEEYCRAWTKANPAVATFQVDYQARTVEASAALFWGARARYVGEHFGCTLE